MDYKELIETLRDESNCDVLDYIDEAADAIEALQSELNRSQYHLNERGKYIDWADELIISLQSELEQVKAERNRASTFIAKNCRDRVPVEGGKPYCSSYGIACDGCEHIWRGLNNP